MNKYNLGQLVRCHGAWREILNIRFGLNDGETQYQLLGLVFWVNESDITAVVNSKVDIEEFEANELEKHAEELQNNSLETMELLQNFKHLCEENERLKRLIEPDQIGVDKDVLFKSWVVELGYNKAILLSCNYSVKKVVEMSQEDAKAEVEAIV